MRKIFFLTHSLLIGLSATSHAECPKLYQSLWPDFCYEHLLEEEACSEIDPHHEIDCWDEWDGWLTEEDVQGLDQFFPFFSRITIHHTHLSECQTLIPYLPELPKSCSCVLCDICKKPVRKSIGIFKPEFQRNYLSMYHQCREEHYSNYVTSRITPQKTYQIYEDNVWHACNKPSLPFVYFNQFTSRYFDFLKHHLQFSQENFPCQCYWPYVSSLSCKINDLVYDQMHDLFQSTCLSNLRNNPKDWQWYEEFPLEEWPELEQEALLRILQNHFIFAFFYSNYHTIILDLCNYVDANSLTASKDLQKLYSVLALIRPLFLQLYSSCLQQHPHPKIFYERGMIHFHNGDLFASLSDMKTFTDSIDDDTLLSSDFYLQEGTSYAELGWYDEALVSLTKSIAKDPQNKEAYFERASLYFETGDFERSIQDFLKSGLNSTPIDVTDLSSIVFAKCLMVGIAKGSAEAVAHALPSLMASVNGLSHGLWAFVCDPSGCSREMVNACKDLLQFLADSSSIELLEAFIPEIRDLHNSQSTEEQTIILGIIIGKYGTEIFAPAGLLKVYKNIRSANRVLTLQHLAKTSKESTLLQEVSTNWNQSHADLIQKFKTGQAELKIYKGKFLTETDARKIIHELGFPTFPKPKGLPNDFRIAFSDRGCGMKYVHSKHNYESVRVMPGKPYSPYPHQQKPYVVHVRNDSALDKFGNKVPTESVEAHIPLHEFIYRPE